MGRRHLTDDEARLALARGREVHLVLGNCERAGMAGIRWATLHDHPSGVRVRIFEVRTPADGEHVVGVDHLSPLNPELDLGDPDLAWVASDLADALAQLRERFPTSGVRLVNEGMLDDEFADFVARRES